MSNQELKSQFNQDIYFGLRRRERLAWIIAILSALACTVMGIAVLSMLPLKTTQAYLGLVDVNTGNVVRAYEVGKASMTEREAVIESWVHNYVVDRETHDIHDQQVRLESVLKRSTGNARQDLIDMWSPKHRNYIRNYLDRTARVYVKVNGITLLGNNTAQVLIRKKIVEGKKEGSSDYRVTLSYRFDPVRSAEDRIIWENPFGFQVTDYRIDLLQGE